MPDFLDPEFKKDRLIERIIDHDVSDGKGAREARRAKLRQKSWKELLRIWDDQHMELIEASLKTRVHVLVGDKHILPYLR